MACDVHSLSDFEELLLRTILHEGNNVSCLEVIDSIQKTTGRKLNLANLTFTLTKLEEKGYISSTMGEATKQRRWRRKVFYRIDGAGLSILQDLEQARLLKARIKPLGGLL